MKSPTSVPMCDPVFISEDHLDTPASSVKSPDNVNAENVTNNGTNLYLQDVLREKAETEDPRGLIIYTLNNLSTPQQVSYSTLYALSKQNSIIIRSLKGFREREPILIHLDDQLDTIVWFWSVILACGLPVISSPLSNVDDHRRKYLESLSKLFRSPICITKEEYLPSFDGAHTLQLEPVEFLKSERVRSDSPNEAYERPCSTYVAKSSEMDYGNSASPAMLMLTSGSTGIPKAVCLTHHQVLAAIRGKASVRPLPAGHAFLNWIGLDHVASLVEIHLQAMWLGVDQVHIPPAAVVPSPTLFLDLLSRHRVSRSFAPNFFLAKLVSSAEDQPYLSGWDLSSLTVLASGGELNDVKTCVAASAILGKYGAPPDVITTGFGMTETCAGAIFNLTCPASDVEKGHSAASLGKCMKGIEMRITLGSPESSIHDETTIIAKNGDPGNLELRGDVVFKCYFRDAHATADAFTPDGWFRTGDQAIIDSDGNLHLIGRVKDVTNINGVKIPTSDIQASVEQAISSHVSRVICFPSKALHTEQVTVAYVPKEWPIAAEEMVRIDELASHASFLTTGSRPLVFALREKTLSILPLSALGKISRAKMISLFNAGAFNEDVLLYRESLDTFQKQNQELVAATAQSATPAESLLMEDFVETLRVPPELVGLDTRIFDLGSSSMDMMRLKRRIYIRLGVVVSIITLMKNPTPRSLAASLRLDPQIQESHIESLTQRNPPVTTPAIEYDPVVTFSSSGSKTPLWLVHPGVGEVLVFVGLANHLRRDERPVYALRARGFENGQECFTSISEAVETYVTAIRQRQPHGPYAIAGYSYGTMLAFEIAKVLDVSGGETVQFLGSFNLPPHIKMRMRHLNWNICLLHLSWFLDLITEDFVNNIDEDAFRADTRENGLKQVLKAANMDRFEELGLKEPGLVRWTDVAFGLQGMAVDYDPSGQVGAIDVFHAVPLKAAAASEKEWIEEHLNKWSDFSRTEPRFHHVGGAHYTMIGPDYVSSFSETLITALRARGL